MSTTRLEPLLELLRDASARDRPGLTLTFARVAELLGEMPDTPWWSEQRGALRSSGYDATVDHDRRWVTFAPAAADEPSPDRAAPAVRVDVRVTFDWTSDGATEATAWVGGAPTPFELSAESARNLAAAARQTDGGGSGI
ncbi:MAG TPA: hypothetical protein VIJ71_03680 [Mycobacteriales bacterium]